MTEISEYILLSALIVALFSICWSAKIIFCDDRNRNNQYNPISTNENI